MQIFNDASGDELAAKNTYSDLQQWRVRRVLSPGRLKLSILKYVSEAI
jgi:hypothetical protein